MTKNKSYLKVEVRRVANGWIVFPGGSYAMSADRDCPPSDIHVFESWERCEEFVFAITEDAA